MYIPNYLTHSWLFLLTNVIWIYGMYASIFLDFNKVFEGEMFIAFLWPFHLQIYPQVAFI